MIVGFGWEELTGALAGIAAIALIVLLIVREPASSRVKVGIFLERHVTKRNGQPDDDELDDDEAPTKHG